MLECAHTQQLHASATIDSKVPFVSTEWNTTKPNRNINIIMKAINTVIFTQRTKRIVNFEANE